ncbi:DUF4129 domain-containing protein [Fictibacillus nanhaiensis]|uniref:DUF4129 domain-containing protein n=1 Tax=Fictibacillus nanhaiensis TaxID=742169 RepID=UPI001C93EDB4|nr:DUF4129 domain-containing protein [Fictibacillus nanhaiensis]MBY6037854.1 DUF4129 domain-containing protein [Fictibacillus nanhaiensis]
MLNRQRFVLYGMDVIFDAMLLFLVYVILLQGATWLDFGIFIAGLLPVVAVSGGLYIYKPKQLKVTLICTFAVAVIVFWLLTSSPLFSIIIALILTWRSTENWKDLLKSDIEVIFTISAVTALLLSLFFKDGYSVVYGAVWIQFMLMLGIKMIIHYIKQPSAEKVWKDFSVPIALIGSSGIIFAFLGPIKQFIYWIVDGVLFLLYYIVAVPLAKLFSYLYEFIEYLKGLLHGNQTGKSDSGTPKKEIFDQEAKEWVSTDYSLLLWSTIALLLFITLFYIWKKKLINNQGDALLSGAVSVLNSADLNETAYHKRRWSQSKDRTRKKFLHFEKTMDKRGFARMPGESASIWFERLNLTGKDVDSVLSAYEKVRYGEEELTHEEFQHYAQVIKKLEKSEHLQRKKSN